LCNPLYKPHIGVLPAIAVSSYTKSRATATRCSWHLHTKLGGAGLLQGLRRMVAVQESCWMQPGTRPKARPRAQRPASGWALGPRRQSENHWAARLPASASLCGSCPTTWLGSRSWTEGFAGQRPHRHSWWTHQPTLPTRTRPTWVVSIPAPTPRRQTPPRTACANSPRGGGLSLHLG